MRDRLLSLLRRRGPLSPPVIARGMGVRPEAVSMCLYRCWRAGLVERARCHPGHGNRGNVYVYSVEG